MQVKIPETEQVPLEYLRQSISKYTGIYYSEQKKDILYIRLLQLCLKNNIKDLSEMVKHLENGSFDNLIIKIAQAVSTTYTYFYREPEVLNYFKDNILDHFPLSEKIRIWSAASSSGQEAYTLSILISEKLGIEKAVNNYSILGTDINPQVIRQAEAGIYGKECFNEMPEEYKQRYFEPVGMDQYIISAKIKSLCLFRRLNLNSDNWPFNQKFHVVFCRNILYYFEKKLQEEVINNIYRNTISKGFLITSVTESIKGFDTDWVTVLPGIHQKL